MNDDSSKEHHSTGSYVEPRVPSITGFGQRKIFGKPKKVLDYSLEKRNELVGFPKIDVCIRIKPRSNDVTRGENTLSILSENTVACSNGVGRDDTTEYTFSSVFGPTVSQKKFFDVWVQDKVLRFLNGNNELIFAYGTTNAGKTYTIHGNPNDPGIIPRTFMLVFNALENKTILSCKYKPDKVVAAHILDANWEKNEEEIRNHIFNNWCNEKLQDELKSFQVDESQTLSGIDDHLTSKNLSKMFDSLKNEKVPSLNHGDVGYSVWATYAEIYNETIYDLLVTHTANQKRVPLKLSIDQNKSVYVRDLTHVCVQSAEEAYKVMTFGKNNLKFASNNLNKLSSRSHCIFTLKLLRLDTVNPKTTIISSMSFCDLAGSERLKKTLNVGDRLRESKNINTSLLVLNKCFSVLRENQKRGENHMVVPYRESKLTQMFQTALTGNNKTGISMAVNVDMSPNLYEETKQVLFMSAIVRSINKTKSKTNKPRPSFAIWANNHKSVVQKKSNPLSFTEEDEDLDSIDEKKTIVYTDEEFKIKFKEEEAKLRQELVAQFQIIIQNNETFHKNQKETMLKNKTDFYEKKINRLRDYYIGELQEKDKQFADLHSNRDVTNTYDNTKNISAMENYEFQIGELKLKNEEILGQLNELIVAHNLLQENLNANRQEIENYKNMVDEANDEYESQKNEINILTQKVDDMMLEIVDKDYEIERLTGSLETKHDAINELECNQELLAANVEKLNMKVSKYQQERSDIAKKYCSLKQQYLNLTKNKSMDSFQSKLTEKEDKITKLLERTDELETKLKNFNVVNKELQNTINVLKIRSPKKVMKSVAVLTDLNNVQLPLTYHTEGKENKHSMSEPRPKRKCKTKASPKSTRKNTNNSEKDHNDSLDRIINDLPTSTKKRKLFNYKPPPFVDNSNTINNTTVDPLMSASHSLHQISKLRAKK